MPQWEYLEVRVYSANYVYTWHDSNGNSGELPTVKGQGQFMAPLFNKLGAQGWELAGVKDTDLRFYFKRPKSA